MRWRTAAGATARARGLRARATDAEVRLWSLLRAGRLGGHKFRRQVAIGRYIADFACPAARLVVEADGGQHGGPDDARRTGFLEAQGYRVVRFSNLEILRNAEGVAGAIMRALAPLPGGEREGPMPRAWEGEGGGREGAGAAGGDHPLPPTPAAAGAGPSLSPPGRGAGGAGPSLSPPGRGAGGSGRKAGRC